MADTETTFGQLITRRRADHGYTQAELAHELHVVQSTVGRWESDETLPRRVMLNDICFALDIQPAELDTAMGVTNRLLAARRAEPAQPRRRHEATIATEMWEHDGRPERDATEPTSVGRHHYDSTAREVFDSMERLGLKMVRR